jgi:hypothetical protein
MSWCDSLEKELLQEWKECIEKLQDLGPIQKRAIIKRYSMILNTLSRRRFWNSIGYSVIRFIVTTGSIAVPALLPIKQSDTGTDANSDTETIIYWTTWGISLLVSLANGMMTLFKIDKTFFIVGQLFEKLQSEGWMYLTLSGHYSASASAGLASMESHDSSSTSTDTPVHNHSTMFSLFMEQLEKLYTRITEVDYNPSMKQSISSGQSVLGGSGSGSASASMQQQYSLIQPFAEDTNIRIPIKFRGKPPGDDEDIRIPPPPLPESPNSNSNSNSNP